LKIFVILFGSIKISRIFVKEITTKKTEIMTATYTNKYGITTKIYVYEVTEKSVYYIWADENGNPTSDSKFRMSLTSFSKYTLK